MFWLQALGVLTPFHATQLASPSHLQAGPWQAGAGGGCEGASALPSLRELPWCSCVLQSVVVPRCRGTAEALQITVGHILGDAGSPYLTGLVRLGGWLGSGCA